MRYNRLGRTGLFVSELCLGTMTFGGAGFFEYMGGLGQDAADPLVKAAADAGVTFFDTANVYSQGLSETITGQAIKNVGLDRHSVVLATKVMGQMGEGANDRGLSRAHIIEQCKASLKRLGTDYIDLYQVHGFDPATPIEETLRALDILVSHGHVRYVGVSNWAAWQVEKALGLSERLNLARFETIQSYYSLAGRDLEREIVPMLADSQMGLLVWSPLAGGFLSGKGDAEGRRATRAFPPVNEARGRAVLDAMRPIAAAHGISLPQVALAWLLARPAVTSVIMGAKRLDQLTDNLAAADVTLSADDVTALDAASALPPEYPGWMQQVQGAGRRVGPNQALTQA
ncbi:aldo/keto reductase [uncultured Sphingomonas sp.]|uniref:aldo/keto reductase n=1 Tax=uncultured Sphingomonas sp. TaxID=158754 RepID=UPI0035CB45F5